MTTENYLTYACEQVNHKMELLSGLMGHPVLMDARVGMAQEGLNLVLFLSHNDRIYRKTLEQFSLAKDSNAMVNMLKLAIKELIAEAQSEGRPAANYVLA